MAVVVSGGGTTTFTLDVSGSAATNYANDLPGSYSAVSTLSAGQSETTVNGALNVILATGNPDTYTLTTPDQYTFVSTGDATAVEGSEAGDTVFGGASMSYGESDLGHDNRIVFTTGNNSFVSNVDGTGDTIAAGSGLDTIDIFNDNPTVFSGTGHTLIETAGTAGVIVMQSGTTTVIGSITDGGNYTIFATAGGEIEAGAGLTTFVAPGTSLPAHITISGADRGPIDMFGGNNLDLTLLGQSDSRGSVIQMFQAGAGNETLDGTQSNELAFFGDTKVSDDVATTVYGGNSDYFSTGVGTEYFAAGAGDLFDINSVSGATNITIADFNASDAVNFESPIISGTSDGSNYTVTLSSGTKVEFLGFTSLPTHTP